MKAIILAAGYATRLYPLTKDKPKALLDIGGRKMLDYLMDEITSVRQIDGVYIVTNHRFAAQFNEWVKGRGELGAPVSVIDDMTTDNDHRLGAIGDIAFAIKCAGIDDDVLVAASDNLFTFNLNDYVGEFNTYGKDTLLAQRIDDIETCKRFAIATLDENGHIIGLVEKPQNPPGNLAVFALYIYRRDTLPMIFDYLSAGNNPDAPGHFPEWLYKRRDVRVYTFKGECVDIGTPEAYAEACARYANRP